MISLQFQIQTQIQQKTKCEEKNKTKSSEKHPGNDWFYSKKYPPVKPYMLILLPFTNVKRAKRRFSPETKAAELQSPAAHQCTRMTGKQAAQSNSIPKLLPEVKKKTQHVLLLTILKLQHLAKSQNVSRFFHKDCA